MQPSQKQPNTRASRHAIAIHPLRAQSVGRFHFAKPQNLDRPNGFFDGTCASKLQIDRLDVGPSLSKHASCFLHAGRHFPQVVEGVAESHFELRQFLEVVAHNVFVGHANTAMQLHRLLAYIAHGIA